MLLLVHTTSFFSRSIKNPYTGAITEHATQILWIQDLHENTTHDHYRSA
jgi:hypothetical protein